MICEDLQIPRYTLGGARHSQATYLDDLMSDSGATQAIAERMAHNDAKITMKHYIELTNKKKLRIKAFLDDLVKDNSYFNANNFFAD